MRRKVFATLMSLIMAVGFPTPVFSQPTIIKRSPAQSAYEYDRTMPKPRMTLEEERLQKRIRQGVFARHLIKDLELEKELPLAATEEDCIQLLNSYGIQPLKGWEPLKPMTEDDYAIVIGKAIGKEYQIQQKAQEVCDEILRILSIEWALHYAQTGRYPMLEKLITDKSIFPDVEPRCPYGQPYEIGGYKPHILPHKHYIETPLKYYFFKERDLVKELFPKRKDH